MKSGGRKGNWGKSTREDSSSDFSLHSDARASKCVEVLFRQIPENICNVQMWQTKIKLKTTSVDLELFKNTVINISKRELTDGSFYQVVL